jgi:hypothetical protein
MGLCLGFGTGLPSAFAASEIVYVKYRGPVDLSLFACEWVERSTVVKRLCYDTKEKYVVVKLGGTYYHYCEVPATVVANWRAADSMGSFYNARIKGNFDCRVLRVPNYSKAQTGNERQSETHATGKRLARKFTFSCESGHWIDTVSDDGTVVKLEDGSIWEVDEGDAIDSALWLPITDILACGDKLINTEDNETVTARRLR